MHILKSIFSVFSKSIINLHFWIKKLFKQKIKSLELPLQSAQSSDAWGWPQDGGGKIDIDIVNYYIVLYNEMDLNLKDGQWYIAGSH